MGPVGTDRTAPVGNDGAVGWEEAGLGCGGTRPLCGTYVGEQMRSTQARGPARSRGWSVAAFAVTISPVLVAPFLAPQLSTWDAILDVGQVSSLIVVLAASLLFYVTWRATGGPLGWLVLGITARTIDALTLTAMTAANRTFAAEHPARISVSQTAGAVCVLALVLFARRHRLRRDPLVLGVGLGLLTTVMRVALISATPQWWGRVNHFEALQITIALLTVAIVSGGLYQLAAGIPWLRWRLTCAWVLVECGHAVSYLWTPSPFLIAMTVITITLGAALIVSPAVTLAWAAIQDQREVLRQTRRELERAELTLRDDHARLHEIRATIAGLTSATHLLRIDATLPYDQRHRIEAMVESEMDRIQRLLHTEAHRDVTVVDLDTIIEPLVVRHQLRGFPVRWRPSGHRVHARGDDLAEVVNVLLENAFQHAAGAGAWIYTRRIDNTVEVAVADGGPGIDQSVRPRIFEWGERSKESGGSGIGLNVAQQLTAELGGYLRLVDSPALGATFVFGLPAEDPS